MFDNIAGLKAATAIEEPKLKIAIVGEQGMGKSWLACTAPQPVFDMDFDQRAASLAGKAGVYVKTYHDENPSSPHAMADLEADIGMFEYDHSQGKQIPATFVLDSFTYMCKAIGNEFIRQQPTMSRGIKLGSSLFKIPQGWDIVNGTRAYVEHIVSRLSVLGNVIGIFHSQDEKDNVKSTKEQKAYTGRTTIQPQYMSSVLSIFNDVWYIDADYSNKRMVKTTLSTDFVGKTSLRLDAEELPDIEAMLLKHKSRK